MDEKVEMKKQDFYEMMYLMEKILYIAELEKVLESIDDITIPYGLTLEALRKNLEPYLSKRVEG